MLRDKVNLALVAVMAIAICGILIYSLPPPVKAQSFDTIHIVSKPGTGNVTVASITFLAGAPSAVISNPYNDQDTDTDPQVLHATLSEPVVYLKNTSGGTLTIWLGISAWTGAVASERYVLSDPEVTTTESLSAATALTTTSTSTGIAIGAGLFKALYLEVTLGAGYGKSGTSTISILGE